MRKLEKSKKAKKPFYKLWRVYAYTLAAILFIGWVYDNTDSDEEKRAAELATFSEASAKANDERAEEERWNAETEAIIKTLAADEAKAEAQAVEDASEFADDAEYLAELYAIIFEEAEGAIVNIDPADDYEIINVQLTEEFAHLPVDMKQAIVDALGPKIEATTRAIMFDQRPSADKLYVYFVNAKGEYLVDTKHLDYGWKAK